MKCGIARSKIFIFLISLDDKLRMYYGAFNKSKIFRRLYTHASNVIITNDCSCE